MNRLRENIELIAAIFSGLLIAIAWGLGRYDAEIASIVFYVAAFLIGGFAKAKEGVEETIANKELNVEMLMIFAAIGSALIGYWVEGAILIFIFSISGALETYTLNKSKKELTSLMAMQPNEAWKMLEDDSVQKVPTESLTIGDRILVKPGELIPVDGILTKGITTVDLSAINGEAEPVTKKEQDELFAGTVNLNGSIQLTMSKDSHDTLFQKIINLVQNAQNEHAPAQQFIDRFEGTYVKIVLVTVVAMMFLPQLLFDWDWNTAFYRAIVLLVVASPCALVASIMPATLAAISNGAKRGILIKGGAYLEQLSTIKAVAFDKTGTLTNGQPVVTDFLVREGATPNEVLALLAGIESQSNHPLARAIMNYAEKQAVSPIRSIPTEDLPGHGLKAHYQNQLYLVGNPRFVGAEIASSFQGDALEKLYNEGKTVIFLKDEGGILAAVASKDTLRKETVQAISQLTKAGIHTIMLTGDNERTAATIAKEAGIEQFVAECLPEQKVAHLEQLLSTYESVAMVGDGINDAPALATATIGVAMGDGTDVALETADVVLMQSDLTKINYATQLAKKTQKIIKQNIFFSMTIIILLIMGNFMQAIDLPLGVIGHEGSTILVILNGLRLLNEQKH